MDSFLTVLPGLPWHGCQKASSSPPFGPDVTLTFESRNSKCLLLNRHENGSLKPLQSNVRYPHHESFTAHLRNWPGRRGNLSRELCYWNIEMDVFFGTAVFWHAAGLFRRPFVYTLGLAEVCMARRLRRRDTLFTTLERRRTAEQSPKCLASAQGSPGRVTPRHVSQPACVGVCLVPKPHAQLSPHRLPVPPRCRDEGTPGARDHRFVA